MKSCKRKFFIPYVFILFYLLFTTCFALSFSGCGGGGGGEQTPVTYGSVGSVAGTVTDSFNGSSISGILVTIGNVSDTTSSTGTYSLNNIPTGQQTLSAKLSGYSDYSKSIVVAEGSNTVDIVMTRISGGGQSYTVSGIITNKNTGSAVTGAVVKIESKETTTDSNGNYQIPDIPSGSHTITVTSTGYDNFSANISIGNINLTYSIELIPTQSVWTGGMTKNTVWSADKSPYIVDGELTIYPGVQLKIMPGVVVKFNPGAVLCIAGDIDNSSIGQLYAVGTKEFPIKFTPNTDSPAPGYWEGIKDQWRAGYYSDKGTIGESRLEYTIIEYAKTGVTINKYGVTGNNAVQSVYIKNSTIKYSQYNGIYVPYELPSTMDISGNIIENNGQNGIYAKENINILNIKGNIIQNNGETGINLGSVSNFTISDNKILNNGGSGIAIIPDGSTSTVTVEYNLIEGNKNYGIYSYWWGIKATISKNTIKSNLIGISGSDGEDSNGIVTMNYNNIYQNKNYNSAQFLLVTTYNYRVADLTNNYWGYNTLDEIIATNKFTMLDYNKIEPFATSLITDAYPR